MPTENTTYKPKETINLGAHSEEIQKSNPDSRLGHKPNLTSVLTNSNLRVSCTPRGVSVGEGRSYNDIRYNP